eukprot:Em0006g619a
MQEAGFSVKFIPTLHFDFVSQRELSDAVSNLSHYSGLILTSQTAVEACSRALPVGVPKGWSSMPIFVVGTATAEAAHSQLAVIPEGGTHGTAKLLAGAIIEYFKGVDRAELKPLLFPCSDLHMETLPSILQEAGLPLRSIVSYQTVPHPDLQRCLQEEEKEEEKAILPHTKAWFVFFSPSGVQFVSQLARPLLEAGGTKLAAIGSTTAEAMKKVGLRVSAVAAVPTPQSLVSAMAASDQLPG